MSDPQQVRVSEESLREDLVNLPKETLAELVLAGGRNCWSVQNHWMEYMFREYGNEAAAKADSEVFGRFTKSMIYRLKRILDIKGDDIPAFMKVSKFFPMQESEDAYFRLVSDTKVVYRINSCTMGKERRRTGRPLLPCKPAGLATFEAMATMVNPNAKVKCVFCPPDEIPPGAMCEWEFEFPAP